MGLAVEGGAGGEDGEEVGGREWPWKNEERYARIEVCDQLYMRGVYEVGARYTATTQLLSPGTTILDSVLMGGNNSKVEAVHRPFRAETQWYSTEVAK